MTAPPLQIVSSVAAVLDSPNIDTDVIIRIERMVSTDPAALAPWAFEALRCLPDGSADPDFVFNQDRCKGAEILLAGANFGCGSSREPAVWAIKGLGIRAIVAPSFGDIFRANCHQNGLLPIVLDEDSIAGLTAAAGDDGEITVDLEARRVRAGGRSWDFAIGDRQRLSLLQGLDDLDLAMRDIGLIDAWETDDRRARPWAWAPIDQPTNTGTAP